MAIISENSNNENNTLTGAEEYFKCGNAYFEKGDYDRAIAEYDQAIRLHNSCVIKYNCNGDAYPLIWNGPPNFEDEIRSLDDLSIQKAFREFDSLDLVMAMKGLPVDVCTPIFQNVSKKAEAMLKADIIYMGPVALSSVLEARDKFCQVIQRLRGKGEIPGKNPGTINSGNATTKINRNFGNWVVLMPPTNVFPKAALSKEEVDQLLAAVEAENMESISGDTEQPLKFSKEQIQTISMIYDNFAQLAGANLSALLRSRIHVDVASVDELSYDVFTRSLPNPTNMALINMVPLEGHAVLEMDTAVVFSIIDKLFGVNGENPNSQAELTDIGQFVMEGIVNHILGNIREAWARFIDLRPCLGQIHTNPQLIQAVPRDEPVILVAMEAKVDDVEGIINFCIPCLTIEPIVEKFSI